MKIDRIILVTGNRDKRKEMQEILPDMNLVTSKELGFTGEIVENGSTFEENALLKARAVWKEYGECVIADDSGLVIDYLGGEPGIFSARYMGEDTSYVLKNASLIERLKDAKEEERSARFYAAVACILPDGEEIVVNGTMEGTIAHEARGENGFGYDPILFLKEYGMTSAELECEEKNRISHRGKALMALREILQKKNMEWGKYENTNCK